jgi:uncharacterized protein (DUF305 family)
MTDTTPLATDDTTSPAWPRWLIPAILLVLLAIAVGVAVRLWSEGGDPGNDSADAGFARDMIDHHAQAVQMALIALERTEDPEIRQVAYDIANSQQAQVGMMLGWLDIWDLTTAREGAPMAWAGASDLSVPTRGGTEELMTGLMPGHLTNEAIEPLRTLEPDEMDVEFLRLMLIHHEGGVVMAEAALDHADERVVRRLADAIIVAQTAEITTMEQMLAEREGA